MKKNKIWGISLLLVVVLLCSIAIMKQKEYHSIKSETYYHDRICKAFPEFDVSLYDPLNIMTEYSNGSYVCLMYAKKENTPLNLNRLDGDEPNSIQIFLYDKTDGEILMLP